jgi:uncharacterized protein YndB with AHSA1/START domain
MNATTTNPLALRLDMRRTIAAPIDRVFNAWTDLNLFKQWLGKGCHPGPESRAVSGDVRVGGGFKLNMKRTDSEMTLNGVYREITPPTRLVFTWGFDGMSCGGVEMKGDTLVTVQFRDLGGKTEIHLVHEGFATEEICGQHRQGWETCLGALEELVRA